MAVMWGSTLIVTKDAYASLCPTDLLANRFGVALLAFGILMPKAWAADRRTVLGGLLTGVLFGLGQVLQGVGLSSTPASVSGFIAGLYVVVTPLLGAVLFGGRIPRRVWMAVIMATLGLAGLALNPSDLSIGIGELLTLASAVCYAGQILVLGRVAAPRTAMSLGLYQTVGAAAVCLIAAAPGGIKVASTPREWLVVLYLGLICTAVVAFLQSWAQARVDTTRAAILMCTEPLWGAVFGIGLGGEPLTVSIVLGAAAILAAMVLVVHQPRRHRVAVRPSANRAAPNQPGETARPDELATAS